MRMLPRRLRRAAALVLVTGALSVATLPASTPALPAAADRYDQEISGLQGQVAALNAQLRTLQQQQTGAAQAAIDMQAQIATTQQQLGAAQQRLDRDNAALATTAQQIQEVDGRLHRDSTQLTSLVVRLYTMGDVSTVNALLDASDMYQLIDRAIALQNVRRSFDALVATVQDEKTRLTTLQRQQQAEQHDAGAAVLQLQSLTAQQVGLEKEYQLQAASLRGRAAQVAAQSQALVARIAQVRAQQEAAIAAAAIAAARAAAAAQAAAGASGGVSGPPLGGALPPFAFGPRTDLFPWGQCTWYVASLRNVTWSGDAWMWLGNARAQGQPTGMAPRAGAIVVWGAGNGYSGYGHVGYVRSVQGPTQFTVDEANYSEIPGQVDQRFVGSLSDVEGFIY